MKMVNDSGSIIKSRGKRRKPWAVRVTVGLVVLNLKLVLIV